jgi:NADH dehydrogenase
MLLITGGTGFVGSHIVKRSLDQGWDVKLLIHRQKKEEFSQHPKITQAVGDILQPHTLIPALEGVKAIIHLVGIIVETKTASFEQIHYQGVKNLVEAAKEVGIKRFIHMSALGSSIQGASRYHQTKGKAEEYLKTSGMDYTIFRPSIIFGPEDQFINWLCRLIRYSPIIPIIGSGANKIQPIYVEDVAEVFVQALDKPETIGQSYDLGGPEQLTMESLINLLLKLLNKKRIKIHLPISLMWLNASLLEKLLPTPPLTRDQLLMIQEDNICDTRPIINEFALKLIPLEDGIQKYLPLS